MFSDSLTVIGWKPDGDLNCFFMSSLCCYIKQILCEENSRICAVSPEISFEGLCHGPQAFSCLTPPWVLSQGLYLCCILGVCAFITVIYWQADTDSILSLLIFSLNCGDFICLSLRWPAAMTVPRCCHLLPLRFGPRYSKSWVYFTLSLIQVYCPDG